MTFKPTSSKTRTSGNPQLDKALKQLNANKKVVDIENLGGLSDEALNDIAVLQAEVVVIQADVNSLQATDVILQAEVDVINIELGAIQVNYTNNFLLMGG